MDLEAERDRLDHMENLQRIPQRHIVKLSHPFTALPKRELQRRLSESRRVSPAEQRAAESLPHKSAGIGLRALMYRLLHGKRAAHN
jgi:hypothetical protein